MDNIDYSATKLPFYVIDGRGFAQLAQYEQLDELICASETETLVIHNPGQELLARLGKISKPTLRQARRDAGAPIRRYTKAKPRFAAENPVPGAQPAEPLAVTEQTAALNPYQSLTLAVAAERDALAERAKKTTQDQGRLVGAVRKARGLSLVEFANAVDLRAYDLLQWEAGIAAPDHHHQQRVVEFLSAQPFGAAVHGNGAATNGNGVTHP
jgi:hypothetical protein